MELVAVRGDDSLFSEDPSLPLAVGFLVQPVQGVIWRISLATALAGGYWEPPGDQPSQAEMEALLDSFPTRDHPSVITLVRVRQPIPGETQPTPGEEDAPLQS